jgi:hypothetical protein
LDKALGLAVRSRGEGPGSDVPSLEIAQHDSEGPRDVPGPVVAHDTLDTLDSVTKEESSCATEKGRAALAAFVRQDFGVSQSSSVVDCDVQEVPADTARRRLPVAVTSDTVTRAHETTELLGVDVNEFARPAADVAILRLDRVKGAESSQAARRTHTLNAGLRDPEDAGDAMLRKTQPA